MSESQDFRENKFLHLDVSGVKFKLMHHLLFKHPDSFLAELAAIENHSDAYQLPQCVFLNKTSNEFHIAKSPKLFDEIVLQFYITGKLHIPEYICKETIRQEIFFWKLNTTSTCTCWEGCEIVEPVVANGNVTIVTEEEKNRSAIEKIKNFLWLTFETPKSSVLAMAVAVVSVFFILLSIASLVLSTVPDFEICNNATEQISISDVEDYDISSFLGVDPPYDNFTLLNVTGENSSVFITVKRRDLKGLWSFFSNCEGKIVFELIDLACIVWFTLELIVRFFACPNKWEFAKSPLNIIDFWATFPYYVEVIVYAVAADAHYLHPGSILVFRLFRNITVLRILKLARYFEDLRILGQTLAAAKQELLMLFLFVLVSLLIFASIVYNLEKDENGTQFTSIPAACWWGIATLTTVGYGDMVPVTVAGKAVGFVTCIAGIMIMSFPTSVLVEHFTSTYKMQKLILVKMATDEKLSIKGKDKKFLKSQSCFNGFERLVKSASQTKNK